MAPRRSARSKNTNAIAVQDVICVPDDAHSNTRATNRRKRKNNSKQPQNKRNSANRGRSTARTAPRPVVISLDVTFSESDEDDTYEISDSEEITISSTPKSDDRNKVKKERLETKSAVAKNLDLNRVSALIKDNRCSLSDSDEDIEPDFCPKKPSQQNGRGNVNSSSDSDSETEIYKVNYEAERRKAFEKVENEMKIMASNPKKSSKLDNTDTDTVPDSSLVNDDSSLKYINGDDSLNVDSPNASSSLDLSIDISSIVLKGRAKIVRRINKKTKNALESLQAFSKRLENDSQLISNSKEDSYLDDDDIIMAEDSTVTIRVCWGTSYTRHILNKTEKFSCLYQEFANENQVSVSQVVLSFKDNVVSPESTPRDIKLSLGDIMEGGILRNTATNSSSESTGKVEGEILLKVQTENRKIVHTISMSKYDKMSVLMDKYSKLRDIPLNKLKFKFDGDILESSDTPSSLDLEGEECIDAFEL